jgi:hypothetical protein
VPDPNALSAPTAAANAAAPEVKTVTDADGSVHESTAAAKASQGSSNVNSAAGPAFVVAGASLVAMLAGVAAVVL